MYFALLFHSLSSRLSRLKSSWRSELCMLQMIIWIKSLKVVMEKPLFHVKLWHSWAKLGRQNNFHCLVQARNNGSWSRLWALQVAQCSIMLIIWTVTTGNEIKAKNSSRYTEFYGRSFQWNLHSYLIWKNQQLLPRGKEIFHASNSRKFNRISWGEVRQVVL